MAHLRFGKKYWSRALEGGRLSSMANEHTAFWLALLNHSDRNQRARLWNGYLGWKLPPKVRGEGPPQKGWPQLIVTPPDGGWPVLTPEERNIVDALAKEHGGYPEFQRNPNYMDFSDHRFIGKADFSGLILVDSSFNAATFGGEVQLSQSTHLYAQTWFHEAIFEQGLFCDRTYFDAPVSFDGSRFKWSATFIGVQFMGGASFTNVVFEQDVMFNDSRFDERYFGRNAAVPHLADFRNTTFAGRASFREVVFGNHQGDNSTRLWPERRADFTNAKFRTATTFRGAAFGGVPAFFNTMLHEDTDFGRVDWKKADTCRISVDYAIRAWERLELMMSKLEKPLDQHRFFRFKMRAKRRTDPLFVRILNWLFDKMADYGWGVGRTFAWWLCHWVVSSIVLYVNTDAAAVAAERWQLLLAAIGTGFANAHAFLRLGADGGYLAAGRKLVEDSEKLPLLTVAVGTAEAVLGPILLFLLLLTLRNRFRLA